VFSKNQQVVKEIVDRLGSGIVLLSLSPLLFVIGIAIAFHMGFPIFFTQPRPGKNGKTFQFYKFRSMTDAADKFGNLLPDEKRLTALGKFLRENSLDELPQLWNIFKGDMSFVGPRPLLVAYLERYTPEQSRRHQVKPGITGWAQINGRNSISWQEKFELDVWYVDHWNLWLDLTILLLTVRKVLKKEGISASEHVTMPEFLGDRTSTLE
jgi:lipopolysaccharide/colanic/teichoic acid biosynthesis glycosyltransferase